MTVSIRTRLALCCATLCALVLLVVGLLSYAIHTRGQYDGLDRTLVTSVVHAVDESETGRGVSVLLERTAGLEVALRRYDTQGVLREHTPGAEALPPVDPRAILESPAEAPFDQLASRFPSLSVAEQHDGAFGLLAAPDQRWRVYVQPFTETAQVSGYIVALAPLGRVDESIGAFRRMLLGLGLLGLMVALISSRVVAGHMLHPIAAMVQTARTIAESRDLSRRIAIPAYRDELGVLAQTFNAMLVSIEGAYRAQQRFVADASHELRTPLTIIQGNLEIVRRERMMSEEDRSEALAETEREAARLSRLVTDLLALARADAGTILARRPVDLDSVVIDAFHSARQLARGQSLSLDPFEPAQVSGDEDRLRQVLIVLLDNALTYTPAGGQVCLGLHVCGDQAEVLVRDTGIGIAPEDLPHVFERFYRADPARNRNTGGTGLGLAIARWIVEQHNGTISAESGVAQGTTVRVRIPLAT